MIKAIELFTGETEITDGEASESLDALTLELVLESLDRLTTLTVADASIERSGTDWTATLPEAATESEREWRYALRQVGTRRVLATGLLTVQYAPGAAVVANGIGEMAIGSTFVIG